MVDRELTEKVVEEPAAPGCLTSLFFCAIGACFGVASASWIKSAFREGTDDVGSMEVILPTGGEFAGLIVGALVGFFAYKAFLHWLGSQEV